MIRALGRLLESCVPNGVVLAAAISRFASLVDSLGREFVFDPDFRLIVERGLHEGQHRNPQRRPHWFMVHDCLYPPSRGAPGRRRACRPGGRRARRDRGLGRLAPAAQPALAEHRGSGLILWSAPVVEAEASLLGLSAQLLEIEPCGPALGTELPLGPFFNGPSGLVARTSAHPQSGGPRQVEQGDPSPGGVMSRRLRQSR